MLKRILKRVYLIFLAKKNKNILNSADISHKVNFGSNIEVGKNTFIDQNCEIGSYTYIGKNCNITKSSIGRFCSIANNVSIGQGEHDLSQISTSSIFYKNSYEELTKNPCVIKNDVWIGMDTIILRGVIIENGAVIGANSVVTKNVPPFAIVAGSPAKIIRYRFDEKKQKEILDSSWWLKDLGGANALVKELKKC